MAKLQCIVVTPEETAMDQEASFVAVPLFDGELGIAPGHSPLIGRLTYGELRVTAADGDVSRHYVDGGFVQVANNVVTILTGKTLAASQLDAAAAEKQLSEAITRPAHSEELLELRDRSIQQARSQIRIARR